LSKYYFLIVKDTKVQKINIKQQQWTM